MKKCFIVYCSMTILFVLLACAEKGPEPGFEIAGTWEEVEGESKIIFDNNGKYILHFNPALSDFTTKFEGDNYERHDNAHVNFNILMGGVNMDLIEVKANITGDHIFEFELDGREFRFEKVSDQTVETGKDTNEVIIDVSDIPPMKEPDEPKEKMILFDEPPRALGNISYPEYPASASGSGIEGAVHVWVLVGDEGEILETEIKNSLSPELDREAINLIRSVKWEPAKLDGKPVSARIMLPIKFRIK